MARDDRDGCVGCGCCIAQVVAVIALVWWADGNAADRERQRAIEAGVGRWVVDAQSGEKKFEYGRSK